MLPENKAFDNSASGWPSRIKRAFRGRVLGWRTTRVRLASRWTDLSRRSGPPFLSRAEARRPRNSRGQTSNHRKYSGPCCKQAGVQRRIESGSPAEFSVSRRCAAFAKAMARQGTSPLLEAPWPEHRPVPFSQQSTINGICG